MDFRGSSARRMVGEEEERGGRREEGGGRWEVGWDREGALIKLPQFTNRQPRLIHSSLLLNRV